MHNALTQQLKGVVMKGSIHVGRSVRIGENAVFNEIEFLGRFFERKKLSDGGYELLKNAVHHQDLTLLQQWVDDYLGVWHPNKLLNTKLKYWRQAQNALRMERLKQSKNPSKALMLDQDTHQKLDALVRSGFAQSKAECVRRLVAKLNGE